MMHGDRDHDHDDHGSAVCYLPDTVDDEADGSLCSALTVYCAIEIDSFLVEREFPLDVCEIPENHIG